jgi:hypothetical protein
MKKLVGHQKITRQPQTMSADERTARCASMSPTTVTSNVQGEFDVSQDHAKLESNLPSCKSLLNLVPFKRMNEERALKLTPGVSLLTFQSVGCDVYASLTPLSSTLNKSGEHSIFSILAGLRFEQVEICNNSRSSAWLSLEWRRKFQNRVTTSPERVTLAIRPNAVLGINALLSRPIFRDAPLARLVVRFSLPDALDGEVYEPCMNSKMWVKSAVRHASNLIESRRSSRRRSKSFCGASSGRLSSIAEIAEDCDVGSQPCQVPETVHDGQFFADAFRNGVARCPNEARHFRMRTFDAGSSADR